MLYRNDIQGLRAVAILLVIAAHFKIPGFSWGFIGVDIFFVISGYLITGLIYEERKSLGSFSYINFYARRARRLLPGMLVMMATVMIMSYFLLAPDEQKKLAASAPYAISWLSNFYFASIKLDYFDAPLQDSLFLHTWSLSVEEQFYLVWPLIIVLLTIKQFKASNSNIFHHQTNYLSIFLILSLISCMVLSALSPNWAYYMMPTRMWQFALGAIGYFFAINYAHIRENKNIYPLVLSTTTLLITLTVMLVAPSKTYPGYLALLPSLAALCLLLIPEINNESFLTKLLSFAPLKYIGDISYSLYLWHWPIWIIIGLYLPQEYVAHLGLALAITLIFSVTSHKFFESPVRHNLYLSKRPKAILMGTSALILGVIVTTYEFQQIAHKNSQSPIFERYTNAKFTQPWIYANNCDQWYFSSKLTPCMSGKMDAKHTAIIFGDSIGLQWITAIEPLFERPDWRFIVYTKSACPMVDENLFYKRIGRDYTECAIWRTQAIRQIQTLKPDVVFLGSSLYEFSQTQWTQGTRRILEALSPISQKVFIIRSTPTIPYNGLDCLTRKAWVSQFLTIPKLCKPKTDSTINDDVFRWISDATKSFTNVYTIDMNAEVCPKGVCELEKNGKIVYRDDKHLTTEFISELTVPISAAIQ